MTDAASHDVPEAQPDLAPRSSDGPPTAPAGLAVPATADLAVCLLTYNNAATAAAVIKAVRAGLEHHFAGMSAALVSVDAGSSDGTPELVAAAGLPALLLRNDAPITERSVVPFHGVPGRSAGLRLACERAQRLGARAVVVLEADVISITDEWLARLAGPLVQDKTDLVVPAYARHRYDGTITNLILAPLIRALYGRRLRQPLSGSLGFSARLVEHLLAHPRSHWKGEATDVWIVGTAIADSFSVWEAWLGPRRVQSRTRTTDLPAMVAQTLGAVFTAMDQHQDLWLEVRGSEPVPAVGTPTLPTTESLAVGVERMIAAFHQGLRDLGSIWEHILAPDTLGEVLALEGAITGRFRFPDDLWARVVYDFALGHRYGVVHREHLLRSLVPLYLGRTAAFVLATAPGDAVATQAALDAVGAAFERQKPYLVARWR